MRMQKELEHHQARQKALDQKIQRLAGQIEDFFQGGLGEEEFDIRKALLDSDRMKHEAKVLERTEKVMLGGIRLKELAEEREALERTIDELAEERAAKQRRIDEYESNMTPLDRELTKRAGGIENHPELEDDVALVRNIDMAITQRALEVSKIDDEIEALHREIEGRKIEADREVSFD